MDNNKITHTTDDTSGKQLKFNFSYVPETITIEVSEYEELMKKSIILDTLIDHGLENTWEPYEKVLDGISKDSYRNI